VAHLDFEKPLMELERRIGELRAAAGPGDDVGAEVSALQAQADRLQRELYAGLSEWQKVQLSRHPERPYFLDYLDRHLRRLPRAAR
jgi:acetyl-CoA carboxylase carboxyl transferase subunit alpha